METALHADRDGSCIAAELLVAIVRQGAKSSMI